MATNNTTNSSIDIAEEESVPVDITAYLVPCIFAVIFLLGITGNGTTAFIIIKNRNMRTTPNIFILSLAFADLLLLLVSVPFYAMIYTFPDWKHGEFLCKLNGFLKEMSLGVSVFTLTALSANRFMAIMYPMSIRSDSRKIRTMVTAGGIWLLAVAIAMFEGTIIHVSDFGYGMRVCHSHPEDWPDWFPCFRAWFRCLIYFLIPVSIIAVLYSLMARSLWQHSHITHNLVAGAGQSQAAIQQAEARKKVAKLVLTMVFLFILCWLPRHIYLLWFQCPSYGFYNLFWHIWKIASYCLCFLNSCINPFALYILSNQFRQYYNQYLFCGHWRRCRANRITDRARESSHNSMSSYRAQVYTVDTTVNL